MGELTESITANGAPIPESSAPHAVESGTISSELSVNKAAEKEPGSSRIPTTPSTGDFGNQSTSSVQGGASQINSSGLPRPAKSKPKRLINTWRHIRRPAKVLAIILGGAVAYYQYLDASIQTNINRQETLFSSTATQLDSESEAVRASAVNTLYELAFTRTPLETPPGLISPFINTMKWLLYQPGYRNFDRCSSLFAEFAAAKRRPVQANHDMVSSQILLTAVKWLESQETLMGTTRKSPSNLLLSEAQVAKARVPSINLHDVQFAAADMSASDLSYAVFNGANLAGAVFKDALMTGGHFDRANLSGTDFSGVHAEFGYFGFATMQGAKLGGSNFNTVHAANANLDGAMLTTAKFVNATLTNVSFHKADLTGVDFSGADLAGADFSGAKLSKTDLRYALGLDRVTGLNKQQLRSALLPLHFSLPRLVEHRK